MRSYLALTLVLAISFIGNSCSEQDIDTLTPDTFKTHIEGFAQKGPFISGSSVTVFDLDQDLSPSGKTYFSQISDNRGSFELNDIELSSNLVFLKADGFYFNEITGKESDAQISLLALSDITNQENININILTTLEKARVEYLVANGQTFSESKEQAQNEILSAFGIQKNELVLSEELDISRNSDDNAILLAISSIVQGFRTESQLTELIFNLGNDLKEDGILSDELGAELLNHAVYLDGNAISNHLHERYQEIDSISQIPSVNEFIDQFIQNSGFQLTRKLIDYPEMGKYGKNILAFSDSVYTAGSNTVFSIAASINEEVELKVKLLSLSSDTVIIPPKEHFEPDTIINHAKWYYALGSDENWLISKYDGTNNSQVFTAIKQGSCDVDVVFERGYFLIEYYEMNMDTPAKKKIIRVE